jgi:hypothetical protein
MPRCHADARLRATRHEAYLQGARGDQTR